MPSELTWLWIPITLWAALAQTLRNAAQRHLTGPLGTLGATLVRFLYGLPFALLWLACVAWLVGGAIPGPNATFLAWVLFSAIAQMVATALLLKVMQERNFTLGVAYSKTELVQVAVFGLVFLGDPLGAVTIVAVLLGTAGVLLLSPPKGEHPFRQLALGWTHRIALLGIASGAGFGLSAVGYRGAALALGDVNFSLAAATTLAWSQAVQTLLLGGWLLARAPDVLVRVLKAWRSSLFAGFMGAAASAGWFTAFAIEPVAHVRTLGLIELLFSYAISRRLFRERLSPLELGGIGLLSVGLVLIALRQ